MRTRSWTRILSLCLLFCSASVLRAEEIVLHLDASDAPRKRLQAQLTIPVQPGPLTLHYPKWLQGQHAPNGPITDLVGVQIRGVSKTIPWKRNELDMFSFECTVPEGIQSITVDLEFLGSSVSGGFGTSISMTRKLAILNWHDVLLYPKGSDISKTTVRSSLTVPRGWKVGTATPMLRTKNDRTDFEPATLERLCDSPLFIGEYLAEIPIGPKKEPNHYLVIVADNPAELEITPEIKKKYDQLVVEALNLFGSHPYRSYRFLVAVSNNVSHFGLEHHESSDNRTPEGMFTDGLSKTWWPVLLPHEMVHSWNGKYRRPAGMVLRDFQQPMRTKLLWVYEGLTEYLGFVLATRSGLWAVETAQANFASIASWASTQTGREWRSLEDTATAAQNLYDSRSEGRFRRRSTDFYDEGALIWFEVDTLIREKSKGTKSLDDFCKLFFGGATGKPEVKGYEIDEILKTLNTVQEYDWKSFFEQRVMKIGTPPPIDGIRRSGWKVSYGETPTDYYEANQASNRQVDLSSSLGLVLSQEGVVVDVVPNKAADRAGIAPQMKLLGVNSRRWTPENLRKAVGETKDGSSKLELLFEVQDQFETFKLAYSEGNRYPRLERLTDQPDYLGEILKPKRKGDE